MRCENTTLSFLKSTDIHSKETTLYGATVQVNEPVGVIGIICPDDFVLLAFISLLSSAIARSNCVVIIPSEKFPLPALNLCQVGVKVCLPVHQ